MIEAAFKAFAHSLQMAVTPLEKGTILILQRSFLKEKITMVAIVDYGAGNLFSVANALEHLAVPCQITRAPKVLEQADGILLPGVGAFPDAMEMLQERGLVPLLRHMALEKPFLGICLGMQVLFSQGEEFRLTQGLNLLPGRVKSYEPGP